jgi:ribosome-binding protein aMBF1 (putative translation factor)
MKKRSRPSLVEARPLMEEWLRRDPEFRALVEKARVTAQIAQLVYDARHKAGLTQRQLADLVGTTQSVIARLESDDYDGHSLAMLRRIADATGLALEVRLVPRRRTA